MEGRNPQPSHEQAKLSVRIPNLLSRKHVAGIGENQRWRATWLVVSHPVPFNGVQHAHPAQIISTTRLGQRRFGISPMAQAVPTDPTVPQKVQQANQENTPEQPPKLPTLKPRAKRALNSCPLSLYLTVTGRDELWRSTTSNVQKSPHQISRTRDVNAGPCLANHIQATTTTTSQGSP